MSKRVTHGSTRKNAERLRAGLLLLAIFLMVALPACGQGCSMCYNNAAAADAHERAALRKGIVALGTPAVLFMGVIGLVAYRSKRDD